jgi:putative FmdB family regulatory protein
MPLYEYACTKCGERVEVIQRMNEAPYAHCPKCGGDMKKMASSPAIQFKGSGFHKTDYASPSSKSDSASETKAEAKGETKSESKTEAKTETKSESKPGG